MELNKHVKVFLDSIIAVDENGKLKVKASQDAFRAVVETYLEQRKTAHEPVKNAMVTVLGQHPRINTALLVAKVHVALGGNDDTFGDVQNAVKEVLKTDPAFMCSRGRDGGVSLVKLDTVVSSEAPTAE